MSGMDYECVMRLATHDSTNLFLLALLARYLDIPVCNYLYITLSTLVIDFDIVNFDSCDPL